MNYYLVDFRHRQTDGRTDGQTESDTYELTVLIAQVSSKKTNKIPLGFVTHVVLFKYFSLTGKMPCIIRLIKLWQSWVWT